MHDPNTNPPRPALALSVADVDKLLAMADGVCALLYIYLLRSGGSCDPAQAARALRCTEAEIQDAAQRLRAMDISAFSPVLQSRESSTHARPLPPPDETPEYTSEELARRSSSDPAFSGLVAETQRVLGKLLSGAELRILFGLYDRLGLQPEVILLLINHCAERSRKRYGDGRNPSLRSIEKEAYIWADREILTLEQAEAHLATLARREALSGQLCRVLGLRGREPSPSERRYMDSWLGMGFSPEALAIAYDRTILGTGRLSWRYMDSIVRSWHGKGLHTPEEIEAGDVRASGAPPASRSGAVPAHKTPPAPDTTGPGDDLARLERLLNP